MPKQPQTPLIVRSELTGEYYCLTQYKKRKDGTIIVTAQYGRHNVTEQIEQLFEKRISEIRALEIRKGEN